ncbi:MAG: TetR/AcrR family transcriptional regulator [Myxococcota bacterium]
MRALTRPGGSSASLREMAGEAGVGLPTIVHYFGSRDGLVRAALAEVRAQGEPWLRVTREVGLDGGLGPSCRFVLGQVALGWGFGLGLTFSQSLAAGFDSPDLGPATVNEVLEPTLAALEHRLGVHQARDELAADADLRHAALVLLCPPLVGLLHQQSLGGAGCRPLDLDRFLDDHVARFVRGWS